MWRASSSLHCVNFLSMKRIQQWKGVYYKLVRMTSYPNNKQKHEIKHDRTTQDNMKSNNMTIDQHHMPGYDLEKFLPALKGNQIAVYYVLTIL